MRINELDSYPFLFLFVVWRNHCFYEYKSFPPVGQLPLKRNFSISTKSTNAIMTKTQLFIKVVPWKLVDGVSKWISTLLTGRYDRYTVQVPLCD